MREMSIAPAVNIELLCGDVPARATLTQNLIRVLQMVDDLGSLYAATKHLHMGYSNTLYAIRAVEGALGCKLLNCTCSKGSVLTDEGRYIIGLFEKVQSESQGLANEVVEQGLAAQQE